MRQQARPTSRARYEKQLDEIGQRRIEEGRKKGGKVAGKGRPKDADSSAGNCPQSYPSRADDSRTQAGHLVGRDPKQIDAGVKVWDGMQVASVNFGIAKFRNILLARVSGVQDTLLYALDIPATVMRDVDGMRREMNDYLIRPYMP